MMTLVGRGRQPLAFMGTGLVAYAAGASWLAARSELVLQPHFAPGLVALAHLWLPGFLLSVCLGAAYQLLPVVMGKPLGVGEGSLWARWGLHVSGVVLLVGGFASGRYEWAGVGGLFVGAGACLFAGSALRVFRSSRRRDVVAWSFPLAAGWLVATVGLGIVMAVNRRWGFLPLGPLELLKAHAHIGLGGFFLTLLQGVAFQLAPMFTMGAFTFRKVAGTGLLVSQLGLVLLAAGLATRLEWLEASGALALLCGLALSGIAFAATLASRKRRKLELGLKALALGAWLLGAAAVGGAALLVFSGDSASGLRLGVGYGLLAIGGGLSLAVLGVLLKIVPFLVWMVAYGPLVGRQKVPQATELSSRTWENVWLGTHLVSVCVLVAAAVWKLELLALLGGGGLALAALIYCSNALAVASHLRGVWRRTTVKVGTGYA